LAPDELAALTPRREADDGNVRNTACDNLHELIEFIRRHDAPGYQQAMQQRLVRQGLQAFVQDTVAPLTRLVGEAWEDGRIEVFEEHLFTELTKRLLRQAIATLPSGGRPRILLTSLPDEQHALGLLMVEALLALEGADCIPLGTQMPLVEISRAAKAHGADIVALSFSTAFPQRQTASLLTHLRQTLPEQTNLWAGGGGIRRLPALAGVNLLPELPDAVQGLEAWRRHNP
jgi:methanogenic corrinoid protein MtbC1